ncbi:hypothetical protein BST95_07460 [Halioglobus japonicus]|uniref:PilZ domain-containing protein n=1 Tax=Halioglobus japonicus TaxID=930805 RepID=A0AAP8ME02_9GAMM|nr:PilZ domain-containing protein [Halioglobus japonicus]AQA18102.1 hypothetical protein BST95_07460 [Halioglobus japonicus]PLW86095.1 PilZ domain-containing protein [Halioglobus japonicus]GHD14499.1 hypothetical protein GCM10007052_18290 [Halioglobus japonicus]
MVEEQPTEQDLLEGRDDIWQWLEGFVGVGGLWIRLDASPSEACPVVVVGLDEGDQLALEVVDANLAERAHSAGSSITLFTNEGVKYAQSNSLHIEHCHVLENAATVYTGLPECIVINARRGEFHARLRKDLDCPVTISGPGLIRPVQGELADLSVGGCRVHLSSHACYMQPECPDYSVEVAFPSGELFQSSAEVRYLDLSEENFSVTAGFKFHSCSAQHESRVWQLVRDIERESARAADSERDFEPSELFRPVSSVDNEVLDSRKPLSAAAVRLRHIADSLCFQWYYLRSGKSLSMESLLWAAEDLIVLAASDAEEALFATLDDPGHPALIWHDVCLAVRMACVAHHCGLPEGELKAAVACALVHDIGYLVNGSCSLEHASRPVYQAEAVAVIKSALAHCNWIPDATVEAVLDSGACSPPNCSRTPLGKLALLLGLLDWQCRDVAYKTAQPWNYALQRVCSDYPDLADWADITVACFGKMPVASRVCDPDDKNFWVRALDADQRPAVIVPCGKRCLPNRESLQRQMMELQTKSLRELLVPVNTHI